MLRPARRPAASHQRCECGIGQPASVRIFRPAVGAGVLLTERAWPHRSTSAPCDSSSALDEQGGPSQAERLLGETEELRGQTEQFLRGRPCHTGLPSKTPSLNTHTSRFSRGENP
jgi:hypothetical protein